jgi:hypothetical protein
MLYGTGDVPCDRCNKAFPTKWELNRHKRDCRPDAAQYLRLKLKDHYPCRLCHQQFNKIREFKKHLFLRHTDVDVKAKYNRSLEDMIGKQLLNEYRTPLMNTIRMGKFQDFTLRLLNKRLPFTTEGIDRQLAIRQDQNPVSMQKRKGIYT